MTFDVSGKLPSDSAGVDVFLTADGQISVVRTDGKEAESAEKRRAREQGGDILISRSGAPTLAGVSLLSLLVAACGGGGGGNSGGGGGGSSGIVIDGYLKGMKVYRANAPETFVVSDENGNWNIGGTGSFVSAPSAGGAVDSSTGVSFLGTLTAPEGATVISPITTIIQKMGAVADVAALKQALGISSSVNPLNYNPLQSHDVGYQLVSAQVANILAAGVKNSSVDVAANLANAIKNAPSTVDLTSSTFIKSLGISDSVATQVAKANSVTATDLDGIAKIQKLVQTMSLADATNLQAALDKFTTDFGTTANTVDTAAPDASTNISFHAVGGNVVDGALNATNTNLVATATIKAGQATNGRAELYVGNVKIASDVSISASDTTVNFDLGTTSAAALQAAVANGGVVSIKIYDVAGNVVTTTVGTLKADYVAPVVQGAAVGGSDQAISTQAGDNIISGQAEAGSVVTIKVGTTILGTATADANGAFSYALTAANIATLGQGAGKSLTLTAVDAAGNATAAPITLPVSVDTALPVVSGLAAGGADQTVSSVLGDNVITGTTEAGSIVTIKSGTTILGTATADASGAFSYTLPGTLADGSQTLTITVTDTAGNTSATSDSLTVQIDRTPPTAGTLSFADLIDSGSTDTSPVTTDTAFTLSLTGATDANAITTVYEVSTDAGVNWASTTAAQTGLSDGAYLFRAVVTDAAGNSATSPSKSVVVDTALPAKPVISSYGDDVGSITNATSTAATTDDTKIKLQGTAEAGAKIEIHVNGGGIFATTNADATGAWSYQIANAAPEGLRSYTVKAIDAAGNTSDASDAFAITVDTTPPATPVISSYGDDVGSILDAASAAATTDDAMPLLQGTAEKGAQVAIYLDGSTTELATVTADATTGAWSYQVASALADGPHSFTAKSTDAAGNTSVASGALTITVDATPPAKPVISSYGDDVGTILDAASTAATTDDTMPLLQGTAEAGAQVAIYLDGSTTALATVTADATTGAWSYQVASNLTEGSHSFTATAADEAGNTSDTSDALTFEVDVTLPARPDISSYNDNVGAILSATSTATETDDTTPLLQGAAEAGAKVAIYLDGPATALATVTADATGAWSYQVATALSEATHQFTATATDAVGNTSAASDAFSITVDATAPAKPVIASYGDDVGTVLNAASTAATTDDTMPLLQGTAEKGAQVAIYLDGSTTALATVTADATTGAWSYQVATALSEAAHSFTAKATDAAGNTSGASDPFSIEIVLDSTPPAKPVISSYGDDVGTILNAASTAATSDDTTPLLKGTAEAGAQVAIYLDGAATALGTVTADATTGVWSYQVATALTEAAHSFTTTATDAAGNTSLPSDAFSITVDTTAYARPVITSYGDNVGTITSATSTAATSDDTLPLLKGTADAGSQVAIYLDGATTALATVTADATTGAWSYQVATALTEGSRVFTAKAIDAAGNTSLASGALTIVVDTTPPAAPVLTSYVDDVGSIQSTTSTAATTDDKLVKLQGTAEAGATITLHLNGGTSTFGTATADANGNWSYQTANAPVDSLRTYTATATDAAGNTSALSSALAITFDTAPPAKPVISFYDDNVGPSTNATSIDPTTDDALPLLKGSAEPGSQVAIYLDGAATALGTVTADATGAWSYQVATALTEAAHSFTVKATDAAGNTSVASDAFSITILTDITAPAKPVISSYGDNVGAVTNATSTATTTDDTTPLLKGTAEAGAQVAIYLDGVATALGTVTADATTGAWSYQVATALTEAAHSFTTTATDAAGNTSDASDPFAITVDLTQPAKPVISSYNDDVGSITNAASAATTTTDDTMPLLTGTAEAGAQVAIYLDGAATALGTVTADATTGVWSYQVGSALADGSHSFAIKATDAAGNTSVASDAFTFTVDATKPAKPVISSYGDDIGAVTNSASTAATTDDTKPLLKGTAEANAQVTIYDGATTLATVAADATGAWSYQVATALTAGAHSFTAQATDAAGNISDASTAFSMTVDTAAPAAPVIANYSDNVTPVVVTASIAAVTNDATPLLQGTAEANAQVAIYVNGSTTALATVTADAAGVWSYQVVTALADNTTNLFTAKATDAAGNTSLASTNFSIKIDTTAPTGGVVSFLNLTDSGSADSPIVTNDTDFALTVTGVVDNTTTGNSYRISTNGTTFISTAASQSGLADGTYYFRAVITDQAGNNQTTASTIVTIDTVAPVVTIDTLPETSGAFLITGTTTGAATGAAVSVVLHGVTYPTSVASNGTWSVLVSSTEAAALVDGESITVNVADAAGNVGTATKHVIVTAGGVASDGLISGALYFVDTDGDGALTAGEAFTIGDATGQYKLPSGPVVMKGGVDISTGIAFTSIYEAPTGYHTITPVTTLIREISKLSGHTVTEGAALLATATGVAATDMPTFNPFTTAAKASTQADFDHSIAYQKIAAELSIFMDVGSAVITGNDASLMPAASLQLMNALAAKLVVPGANLATLLQNSSALTDLLGASHSAAATQIALANAKIASVTGDTSTSTGTIAELTDIVKVQIAAKTSMLTAVLNNQSYTSLDTDAAAAKAGVIAPSLVSAPVASFSQAEGGADGATWSFAIHRGGDLSASELSYAVQLGPYASASDFPGGVLPTGKVLFAEGQTDATVTVTTKGDTVAALGKTFVLNVSDPNGQTQFLDSKGLPATSLKLTFTATNDDAPALEAPSAISVKADTSATVAGLAIDYPDADALLTVTVSGVTGSHINLTGATGTGTESVTLTGKAAAINTALAQLSVSLPASAADSSLSVTVAAAGVTATTTSSIAVGIVAAAPVNAAPTIVLPTTAVSVNEQIDLALTGAGIAIADADASAQSVYTVRFSAGQGVLTATPAASLNLQTSVDATGGLVLSGRLADLQSYLAGGKGALTYKIDSNAPPASDALSISVSDGALTTKASLPITITPLNDAPVLAANPATTFVAHVPVAIAPALTLSDADSSAFSKIKVVLATIDPDVDKLSFNAAAKAALASAGLVVPNPVIGTGALTLEVIGTLSAANAQAILRGITFESNTADQHTVTIEVTDSSGTVSSPLQVGLTTSSYASIDGTGNVTLAGDPGVALVNVDLVANRVSANGFDLSTSGSKMISASHVDASASTAAVRIVGDSGANIITGSAQADVIIGGGGADQIQAGDGADNVIVSKAQLLAAATIDGGSGIDTLTLSSGDYVSADFAKVAGFEKVVLSGQSSLLLEASSYGKFSLGSVIIDGSGATSLSLAATDFGHAVNVTGSAGADVLAGSKSYADTLSGGAGADTLLSTGGGDSLFGGDVMSGGDGLDTFNLAGVLDPGYATMKITDLAVGETIVLPTGLTWRGMGPQVDGFNDAWIQTAPNGHTYLKFETDSSGGVFPYTHAIDLGTSVPGNVSAWTYDSTTGKLAIKAWPAMTMPTGARVIDEDANATGRLIAFNGTGPNIYAGSENVGSGLTVGQTTFESGMVLTAHIDNRLSTSASGEILFLKTSNDLFRMDGNDVYYRQDTKLSGTSGFVLNGKVYSGSDAIISDTNAADDIKIGSVRTDTTVVGGALLDGKGGRDLSITLTTNVSSDIVQALLGEIGFGIRLSGGDSTDAWGSYAAGTAPVVHFKLSNLSGTLQDVSRTMTIVSKNDAPVAHNDVATLGTYGNVAGWVLANDDPDILPNVGPSHNSNPSGLLVTGVTSGETHLTLGQQFQSPYGAVTFNSNGSYTYTVYTDPAAAATETVPLFDTFHYTMTDGSGATSEADLKIMIDRLGAHWGAENKVADSGGVVKADTIFTYAASDQTQHLYGFGGNDDLGAVGTGTVKIDGGDGDDVMYALANYTTMTGGAGVDRFVVGSADVHVRIQDIDIALTPTGQDTLDLSQVFLGMTDLQASTFLERTGQVTEAIDAASGKLSTVIHFNGLNDAVHTGDVTLVGVTKTQAFDTMDATTQPVSSASYALLDELRLIATHHG